MIPTQELQKIMPTSEVSDYAEMTLAAILSAASSNCTCKATQILKKLANKLTEKWTK